jgi:hypothetical protein
VKKFTAVLLLLVFLCNVAGIFGLFFILKQDNYESVFSRKANELKLVQLTIPKSKNIDWEKADEIVYEGRYYDVFSKTEDTQNIYLLCYSDTKDEQLAQALHKHLDDSYNDNSKKKPNPVTLKITSENYLLPLLEWNIQQPVEGTISIPASGNTICGFISVFSPPPDILVC